MPWCCHCEKYRPVAAFNARSDRPSGLQSRCRKCARECTRESMRRLRADPTYKQGELLLRQAARIQAQLDTSVVVKDPIAELLARFDARHALRGLVKARDRLEARRRVA